MFKVLYRIAVSIFIFLMIALTSVTSKAEHETEGQKVLCGPIKDMYYLLGNEGQAVVVKMLTDNNVLADIWRDEDREKWSITLTSIENNQTCLYLIGTGFVNTIWSLKPKEENL